MPIQEFVVRKLDGLWQVWHGDELLDYQSTYLGALRAAEGLGREAAQRGDRSTIVIGPIAGVRVEFPGVDPAQPRA